MKKTLLAAVAAFFMLGAPLLAIPAQASIVDVQFGTGSSTQYSGSAIVGASGDDWNYFRTGSNSGTALENTSGGATAVTFNYQAQGGYTLSSSNFKGTSYWNLMQSFIYSSGSPITATFKGLTVGENYTLDVLGQSDANSNLYGGAVTVNGVTENMAMANDSTFVNGVNYLVFTGVVGSNGQISISDAVLSGKGQTMINGIQLSLSAGVSGGVPEPSTYVMGLLGFLAVAAFGARRSLARA